MTPKKVLIVEDNDLNLKLFRDLLGAHDITTVEIKDGTKALEMAINEKPDLILLDIQLPHISGLVIAGQLKANAATKAIPIIAVTAFAMSEDETKILASGCEAYLAKPISIKTFIETVHKYLKTAA